jgi:DNA-directed RNA polymerase specialized sigma24 family protein
MDMKDQSEREQERRWVLAARRRDSAAFRRLVDAYERRLLYFLLRFVPEAEALDVLQDVWLTVYRRLPALHAPEPFRVWLYRIAHDKAVSYVRALRRQARAREELPERPRRAGGGGARRRERGTDPPHPATAVPRTPGSADSALPGGHAPGGDRLGTRRRSV